MNMSTSLTNTGLLTESLDGRRPTAPGNDFDPTGQYQVWYNRAYNYYRKFYDWTSDRWRREIQTCADSRAYCHDGYMACLWDFYYAATDREERMQRVSVARDRLIRELGPREFTLTYSPAWYADDATAQDAMRVAIDKLTRYYKDDIIEFHAIGEYTEAGRSHIHCYYELDGGHKITDKNFKRAWEHWNPRKKLGTGHQGGHHANIRGKSDFLGYIEKDLDTAWMNVHITRNANDNQTTQRDGRTEELSHSSGTDDSQANGAQTPTE